tara:strand:+ start:681 stop:782 length:102 start_codon:yes stop_codon:yes gene_type:complete
MHIADKSALAGGGSKTYGGVAPEKQIIDIPLRV